MVSSTYSGEREEKRDYKALIAGNGRRGGRRSTRLSMRRQVLFKSRRRRSRKRCNTLTDFFLAANVDYKILAKNPEHANISIRVGTITHVTLLGLELMLAKRD